MSSGEYRQKPLEVFETIEAIRTYMVSSEADVSADPNSPYTFEPGNFLDAVENDIASIDFKELAYSLGFLFYDPSPDTQEDNKPTVVLAANSPHEVKARSLALIMAQVDRRNAGCETVVPIKQYVELAIEEMENLFPGALNYRDKAKKAESIEGQIIADASKRFFESHPSLAKLALSHLWDTIEKSK